MGPQPLDDEIEDSLSTTVHETPTLLVYQPLLPSVPLTLGVMTGGVASAGTVRVNVTLGPAPVTSEDSGAETFHFGMNVYVPGAVGAVIVTVLLPLSWSGLGGEAPQVFESSGHVAGIGPMVALAALRLPPEGTVDPLDEYASVTEPPLSTCWLPPHCSSKLTGGVNVAPAETTPRFLDAWLPTATTSASGAIVSAQETAASRPLTTNAPRTSDQRPRVRIRSGVAMSSPVPPPDDRNTASPRRSRM